MPDNTPKVKVSIFITCLVDQLYPEVGESMVRVLEKLGVSLGFPESQTCCGQPAFNSGYRKEAKDLAEHFLNSFNGSNYIVAPSGSCVAMVKNFYKELFHGDSTLQQEADGLSQRVFEFSQFLVDVLHITDVGAACSAKVTYHDCCHLRRELGVMSQPRILIKAVKDAEFVEMDRSDVCCGFGGTFAVKYADISGAILAEKADHVKDSGADILVANDISCLMHMAGSFKRLGVKARAMHLAQFLDQPVLHNSQ